MRRLRELPDHRDAVIEAILTRAPEEAVAGGRAALRAEIQRLLDNWKATAEELPRLTYSQQPDRLLHVPLDPVLENLPPAQRAFVAARSMRDVEPNVLLRIRDPLGQTFRAEDVA